MENDSLREKLHKDIDSADDQLLILMLELVHEYNNGGFEREYDFTAEDIEVLDKYRAKRLSGESKTYSWEEAEKIITSNKPRNSGAKP